MFRGQRVAVVVPAHNEARLIARTLSSVPGYVDDVVVVDDASVDATRSCAEQCGDGRVQVVVHPANRGVGAAIATGYERALQLGAEVVAVMAGDAQMDPTNLPALLEPVVGGSADYAKGNRLQWPNAHRAMPPARWLGNHVLSAMTRAATGLRIQDSQCGYTAISARALRSLDLGALWPRYGYPNDLLASLARVGARVVDVPVRPVYADEQSGLGWRDATYVIPWVLGRAALRRWGDAAYETEPAPASPRGR